MVLINDQKEIVDNIFNNLSNHKLHNIPTGKGKTFILLAVAKKVKEELGKKVIISTSTNQLVKEFMSVSQEYDFDIDKDNIEIQIGKSNYIEYSSYIYSLESGELEQYITKESLEEYNKFIKQNNNNETLFFMDFNEIVCYKDIAFEETVKKILVKTNSKNKKIFQSDITITNHFFLISSLMNTKNFELDDYAVLLDEVHLMGEVAETVLSNRFSVFGAKLDLIRLKTELKKSEDFVGKQSMIKNIDTARVAFNRILTSFSDRDKTGSSGDNETKAKFTNKLANIVNSRNTKALVKQIDKNKKRLSISGGVDFAYSLKEFSNIFDSFRVNERFIEMGFTPSLGYPLLVSFRENPLGMLNKKLWSKLKYFSGVSATVSPSFSPNEKQLNYALKRLGMLLSDKDISIEFYNKYFPKELIKVHKPRKNMPAYKNVYAEDFNINNSEYHKYIIDFIHKNHNNKNSIIFCGGYKEAELLSGLYLTFYNDMNILKANKQQKSFQTINDFKKQGGLLFATRDYGVGVSLKAELLENLFVLRLPYPIVTGFKWEILRKRNRNTFFANMNYEMLISLMQLLGRLQRSKTDKGSIFLLDERYNSNRKLKSRIDEVLEFYGEIQEEENTQKKVTLEEKRKNLEDTLTDIIII